METPIQIDYYTDVLCVWAWIAERRMEEIEKTWGSKIEVQHRCVNVFGDTATRIGKSWADRDGYAGFAHHVEESAAPYETAPINPRIWRDARPASSATPHLVLKAVDVAVGNGRAQQLASILRKKFFVDAIDIGEIAQVLDIAAEAGFDRSDLSAAIDSGSAIAGLMNDYERAKNLSIKGSPTWVLNKGRQTLYGNVGYRLINANIEELVKRPQGEASWC